MSIQKKQTTEQRLKTLEQAMTRAWQRLNIYDKEIFDLMPKKRQAEILKRNEEHKAKQDEAIT